MLTWEREIMKCGSSLVVRLPPDVLRGMGWKLSDKVTLTLEKDNTELCIRKGKK